MGDFPLLRVGILITLFAVIGLVLFTTLSDDIDEWFDFSKIEENEYRLKVDIGTDYETIKVNGHELSVEIADTSAETSRGLSGHEPLGANEGMLFLFDSNELRPFWMNKMLFDLDIIWIRDGIVVEIAKNMPAPVGLSVPATHYPKEEANMVLEINAGRADELGIKEGTEIEGLPIY